MAHTLKVVPLAQRTPEWLAFRKGHIMASDAPVIVGASKWRTPFQLWEEKLGLSEGQPSNPAMKFGTENETVALDLYCSMTGHTMNPVVIGHREISWMGASLDGLDESYPIAVEIKCANAEDHALAKQGIIPIHYYAQLQHQLCCLDHAYMHYFSYHKGEGVIVKVERDLAYIAYLLRKEREFLDNINNLEPPEKTSLEAIDLADDILKKSLDKYDQLCKSIDNLTSEKEALRELIISYNSGDSFTCSGYKISTYTPKPRESYDTKAMKEEGIDIEKYKKYTQSKPSWRITPPNRDKKENE
jgi:putative phage-type endonuclease